MVSGFEFAVGAVRWVGLVVETAVGQRSTEAFVKEQKEQRDLDTFCGEPVSVPRSALTNWDRRRSKPQSMLGV